MAGRFAPSPTGNLHVGNLRTAILAWLFARSTGREFLLRVEDLDRVRVGSEVTQIRELTDIGLDWDGPIARQSERHALYDAAIDTLATRGLTFECFCTRRDIHEASSAPHALPGHYPGTCRDLTEKEREVRRRERPSAFRLRSHVERWTISDILHGSYTGAVDDFVLRRNDGAPAYNLAVVVDDYTQGVDQVVRGDDLLSSAPRQAYLGSLLGYSTLKYTHVPLALNTDGQRLAKRDGAVTLEDLARIGIVPREARALMLDSLGLPNHSLSAALANFDPATLSHEPWIPEFAFKKDNF